MHLVHTCLMFIMNVFLFSVFPTYTSGVRVLSLLGGA